MNDGRAPQRNSRAPAAEERKAALQHPHQQIRNGIIRAQRHDQRNEEEKEVVSKRGKLGYLKVFK